MVCERDWQSRIRRTREMDAENFVSLLFQARADDVNFFYSSAKTAVDNEGGAGAIYKTQNGYRLNGTLPPVGTFTVEPAML